MSLNNPEKIKTCTGIEYTVPKASLLDKQSQPTINIKFLGIGQYFNYKDSSKALQGLQKLKAEHNLNGCVSLLFDKVRLNSNALRQLDQLISLFSADTF